MVCRTQRCSVANGLGCATELTHPLGGVPKKEFAMILTCVTSWGTEERLYKETNMCYRFYVRIDIEIPETITDEQRKTLEEW